MAYRIADGFDFYLVGADAVSATRWDSTASWAPDLRTRFGKGRCFGLQANAVGLIKTGLNNEDTVFVHAAVMQSTALGAAGLGKYISLRDGATNQCTIVFRGDGSIVLTSGGPTGSVLATYSSAFVLNSYDSYQFKVVIHNSAGEFRVRKNGASSDSFSATSLNTRGGTANDYVNAAAIGHSSGTTHTQWLDDFAHWDDNGGAPWNDWMGDIRAIPCRAALDDAVQFSRQSAGSLSFGRFNAAPNSATIAANVMYGTNRFLCTQGGKFSSVDIHMHAAFTGNIKIALYETDGDKSTFTSELEPGRLVAVSNVLNNPVIGVNAVSFPSDVAVINGRLYNFCLLADGAAQIKQTINTNSWSYSGTSYSGGFPADVSDLMIDPGNIGDFVIYTTLTATNAGVANDEAPDGVTTYVFDNVVGNVDVYTLEDLPYTPSQVFGVILKSFNQRSDAGGKLMRIGLNSGGTVSDSANHDPLTTFSGFDVFYLQDPNTSAQWGAAGVNALKARVKVQA